MSPGIVGLKRGLERERVKDGLRGWLKGVCEEVERRVRAGREGERSVKGLVRRFAVAGGGKESFWGRGSGEKRRMGDSPTRAHVLGLRRFWEGVGRKGQAV